MNRRRYRSRRKSYRKHNASGQIISVLMVVCLSVAAGYLTATQLLGPALGLETQMTFFDFVNEKNDGSKQINEETTEKNVVEDTVNTVKRGFALQYGSFSTEAGAHECANGLKLSGIETEIIEKDGMFKVIGQVFDTKAEAENHKAQDSQNTEVFITEIP